MDICQSFVNITEFFYLDLRLTLSTMLIIKKEDYSGLLRVMLFDIASYCLRKIKRVPKIPNLGALHLVKLI